MKQGSRHKRGGRPDQRVLDKALAVKMEAEAEAAKGLPIHEKVDVMKAERDKRTKKAGREG